MTDLSDSEQASLIRRLEESEQRFRGAFETAAIGMALVSLEGRWLDVNASICNIVGYERDELLRTDFQTITHPDDLDKDLNLLRQLLAGDIASYRMEKRYIHKAGGLVWVVLSVSLVRDAQGSPVHFVSQIEDITAAKRAQAELERSNQELEEFAAVVSHDLKAPLRGVRGFSQILQRRVADKLSESELELLSMIDANVDRADALVDDLLTLARLGSPMTNDVVDTQDIAAEVLDGFSTQLNALEAVVHVGELHPVHSSQAGMRQMMQNLVSNAIKFRHPQRTLHLEIACRRELGDVIVTVTDNGLGIEPRHAERIFKAFERLHGDEIEGTGIGLAICKKVAEQAGGEIWVEATESEGAVFAFRMPAAELPN